MSLSGTSSGNYSLIKPVIAGNITAKELTVSGAVVSPKVYDGTTNATISGATLNGVITGDDVDISNAKTGFFDNPNVGKDKIVVTSIKINGTSSANYILIEPSLTGEIKKADLNVTAIDKTRCFGEENPSFEFTINGFVNNESMNVIDKQPILSCSAAPHSSSGTYTIYVSGGEDGNYNLIYSNANLTIKEQPIAPTLTLVENNTLHSSVNKGYIWYNENGKINQDSTQDLKITSDGQYYAKVFIDGCYSEKSNIMNIVFNSINNNKWSNFNIYPNPFFDKLNIESDFLSKMQLEIVDQAGRIIYKENFSGKVILDTKKMQGGLYLVKITGERIYNSYIVIKK